MRCGECTLACTLCAHECTHSCVRGVYSHMNDRGVPPPSPLHLIKKSSFCNNMHATSSEAFFLSRWAVGETRFRKNVCSLKRSGEGLSIKYAFRILYRQTHVWGSPTVQSSRNASWCLGVGDCSGHLGTTLSRDSCFGYGGNLGTNIVPRFIESRYAVPRFQSRDNVVPRLQSWNGESSKIVSLRERSEISLRSRSESNLQSKLRNVYTKYRNQKPEGRERAIP